MSTYIVLQRLNDGSINQGQPRFAHGPFTNAQAAEAFRSDREAEDHRAQFIYTLMLLHKP